MKAPALAIAVAVTVLWSGCDAGEVAKKATGIHTTTIKAIYAPKLYCDEVKDAIPDPGFEDEVAYRLVCLKNRQWGRNLVKACRQQPALVRKQHWMYTPPPPNGLVMSLATTSNAWATDVSQANESLRPVSSRSRARTRQRW